MGDVLNQLKEMGFEEARARAAIKNTSGQIETAMEWLIAHQDDPLPDEVMDRGSSVELVEPGASATDGAPGGPAEATPNSFKCDDCGKLLRDQDAVMFHAAKTNHENFSESCEERAAKAQELKQKLLAARKVKEEQERKEQVEKERRRREEGKLMIDRKEKIKENELRQIAEDRKREKLEDQKARQRILDQIKADKEARKAKEQGLPPPSSEPSVPQHACPPPPKVDYKQANIQIRLPSGQAVRQTFDAKEPLSAVRCWIELNHNSSGAHFDLLIPFPRKVMDSADYEAPLDALGLVPSAVLVMTRGH